MAHKFDVNNKKKLDNPKRRELLPPNQILLQLGLQEGEIIADVGAGIGYFSFPAAEIVGDKGIVYAIDSEPRMIEEIDKKIEESGSRNVRAVVSAEYDLKIADNTASFTFICTVLHEVEDMKKFLNELLRITAKGGRIVVIEWAKTESDWGPVIEHRLESGIAQNIIEECGFKDIKCILLNEHFYVITGLKL